VVHSQNGWPAFHTAEAGNFVRFTVAGRGFWAANADVAVVAGEFLRRFDAEVEDLVRPGEVLNDWSFADRMVRGSTADVSNHGSATAWDVNSDHHPLGVAGTFSTAEARAIRAIIRSITDDANLPVLRWGGDYHGRKDEMHIEVIANAARVKQAANKIRSRQAQPQEDDVSFQDKHKLTEADVKAYGLPASEIGKTKSYDELIRFSPADARIRREMAAGFAALNSTIGLLAEALKKGGGISLTAAQITAASEAGVLAALGKVGDLVDGKE